MKKTILFLFSLVLLTGCGVVKNSQNLSEMNLVGPWQVESGSDFDEITLSEDGRYTSFLHSSPFDMGDWDLENGNLKIDSDASSQDVIIENVVLEEGILKGDNNLVWKLIK